MYGNEDQTSALRASPAQVTMLTSRPAPASPARAVNGHRGTRPARSADDSSRTGRARAVIRPGARAVSSRSALLKHWRSAALVRGDRRRPSSLTIGTTGRKGGRAQRPSWGSSASPAPGSGPGPISRVLTRHGFPIAPSTCYGAAVGTGPVAITIRLSRARTIPAKIACHMAISRIFGTWSHYSSGNACLWRRQLPVLRRFLTVSAA